MSFKSFVQIIILFVIITIIGGVYFKYFSTNKPIIEETSINSESEKLYGELEKKFFELEQKNKELKQEIESKIDELEKNKNIQPENLEEKNEKKNNLKSENKLSIENKEEKEETEVEKKIGAEEKKKEVEKKIKAEEKKKEIEIKLENKEKKKKKIKNVVKDVEYISTDKKGNRFRLLSNSAKSNSNNNDLLDLDNVRGVITSDVRDPIYIVSDFAIYNSGNLNSYFYQNVIINYQDKEITCENFDIDMETNIAIAYNNVIITDPKSIMKAGEVTFDLKTKDININPVTKKNKVKVITN